jgi:hypothetical protein
VRGKTSPLDSGEIKQCNDRSSAFPFGTAGATSRRTMKASRSCLMESEQIKLRFRWAITDCLVNCMQHSHANHAHIVRIVNNQHMQFAKRTSAQEVHLVIFANHFSVVTLLRSHSLVAQIRAAFQKL